MDRAYLILEDGSCFSGEHFGAAGTARGELVFTTAMTGCAESLTDPSYYGQLVIFTFPSFGNYGIALADRESEGCAMGGVVVRQYCPTPSNFRCEESVSDFLKREGVVGIAGVDTRALTQKIREGGVMQAILTTEAPPHHPPEAQFASTRGAVAATSTRTVYTLTPETPAWGSVALLDYGAKGSIARCLLDCGCSVAVFPHDTPAETILAGGYQGVMLSNGPGDPQENDFAIRQIRTLLGRLPLFGICLGHQMLALAAGARTEKMKFGHRGANQPVRDVQTGRIYITSQNHGYAVSAESLAQTGGVLRFVNANDGSCEGADYPAQRAFSLQFHPEAHGGPLDCRWAFTRFAEMMKEGV